MEKTLTESEIREELTRLSGWQYADGRIVKTFQFKHFAEAMSFIVRLSYECERRDHHPEIYNLYNVVTIGLNTHSCGDKVTMIDVMLAKDIEHFAWRD
jgi:4a-hydroxytetrahydrobiopterin dehydratase